MEFLKTMLIACIPAFITGVISYVVTKSQANNEIKKLQLSNEHGIQQLMEQHKIDIDAIREEHRLAMEAKEKDHQYKLEIMQKDHENEMVRKEKELEDGAKFGAASTIMSGLFNNLLGSALNLPDVQNEIGHQLTQAMKMKSESDKKEKVES